MCDWLQCEDYYDYSYIVVECSFCGREFIVGVADEPNTEFGWMCGDSMCLARYVNKLEKKGA